MIKNFNCRINFIEIQLKLKLKFKLKEVKKREYSNLLMAVTFSRRNPGQNKHHNKKHSIFIFSLQVR